MHDGVQPLQQRLAQVEHDVAADGGGDQPVRHHPAPLPPLGREERGYRAGPVQPQRLRRRRGQVLGQPGKLTQRAGMVGAVYPFGVLIEGEPPVGRRLGEDGHHAFAVGIGRAQVARLWPRHHLKKISGLDQARHHCRRTPLS